MPDHNASTSRSRAWRLGIPVMALMLLMPLIPAPASAGTVSWDDIIGTWHVVADNESETATERVVIEVSANGTDSAGRTAYIGVVTDAAYSDCLREGTVVWPVIERFGTRVGTYRMTDGLDGACEPTTGRTMEARTSPGMFDSLNYGNTWQLFPGDGDGLDDPDDIVGVYESQTNPAITVEVTGQAPLYAGEVVAADEGSCYTVGQQLWPDIRFGRGAVGSQYGAESVVFGEECLADQPVSLDLDRDDEGQPTRLRVDRGAQMTPRLRDFTRVGDLDVEPPADPAFDPHLARFRGTYSRGNLTGRDRLEVVADGDGQLAILTYDRCTPDGTRVGVIRDAEPQDDGTVTATISFDVVDVPRGTSDCVTAQSATVQVQLRDQVFTADEDDDPVRYADVQMVLPPNEHTGQTPTKTLSLFDLAESEAQGDNLATRLGFFYDLVLGGPPSTLGSSAQDGSGFAQQTLAQGDPLPVYLGTAANFPDGLALAGVSGATHGVTVLLDPEDQQANQALVDGLGVPVSRFVVAGGQAAVPDAALPDTGTTPLDRVAGTNRFDTAARLSQGTFSPGVPVVYVATGANFPDALSGGAQAARDGAPVLLVDGGRMPAETGTELQRLQPALIIALGGEAVIPPSMLTELQGYAPTVERLAGPSRFDTAVEVSRASEGAERGVVMTAPAGTFPDALVLAALAWFIDGPLLLVPEGQAIPDAVVAEVARLGASSVLHLGPAGSLSPSGQAQLSEVLVER